VLQYIVVHYAQAEALLRHCGDDARLIEIISHYLEIRECFNHEEDDAGGYIA